MAARVANLVRAADRERAIRCPERAPARWVCGRGLRVGRSWTGDW